MFGMTPIFRWSGEYFGFLTDGGFLFDSNSGYIGWVADGHHVWSADGSYMGERTDVNYIVRLAFDPTTTPKGRTPPPEPTTPMRLPPTPPKRTAREPHPGYVDALDPFV